MQTQTNGKGKPASGLARSTLVIGTLARKLMCGSLCALLIGGTALAHASPNISPGAKYNLKALSFGTGGELANYQEQQGPAPNIVAQQLGEINSSVVSYAYELAPPATYQTTAIPTGAFQKIEAGQQVADIVVNVTQQVDGIVTISVDYAVPAPDVSPGISIAGFSQNTASASQYISSATFANCLATANPPNVSAAYADNVSLANGTTYNDHAVVTDSTGVANEAIAANYTEKAKIDVNTPQRSLPAVNIARTEIVVANAHESGTPKGGVDCASNDSAGTVSQTFAAFAASPPRVVSG